MSSSLVVCEVDESLKDKLKKFRFRKETSNAAILMKIDMAKQLVILEEEYDVSQFFLSLFIYSVCFDLKSLSHSVLSSRTSQWMT
uniref:ADF-H domain-containing protein n=1 Tax=Astatotilapia calliptera TaxID=8154 RepID=A0AAX7VTE2_ASTCA